MPTTAIALGGSEFDADGSRYCCSRSLSCLPPRCGSLARCGTLLGSIANFVGALGGVVPGEAELTDEIGREVLQ